MGRKLIDKFFNDYIQLYPDIGIYSNIPNCRKDIFTNYLSTEFRQNEKKLYQKYLTLTKRTKNKYNETLQYNLEHDIKATQYPSHLLPIGSFDNPILMFIVETQSPYYPLKTSKDAKELFQRFESFPIFINTCIENMKIGIKKSITQPTIIMKTVLSQLHTIQKNNNY